LELLPLQSPKAARLGIPPERLHRSIHLVERDGAIFHAAAAALRLLARDSRHRHWLRWYERDATFAEVSEAAYAFIAQHRYVLSWLLPRSGLR
jgi:predicted DCC family thiol-disulfide oxidoreductase YuxK